MKKPHSMAGLDVFYFVGFGAGAGFGPDWLGWPGFDGWGAGLTEDWLCIAILLNASAMVSRYRREIERTNYRHAEPHEVTRFKSQVGNNHATLHRATDNSRSCPIRPFPLAEPRARARSETTTK
jgi:hypothetical protein